MGLAASARLGWCRPLRVSPARSTSTTVLFAANCRCEIRPRPRRSRSRMSAANRNRRIGVILAAGRGGRMGGRKQLTAWPTPDGSKPLVAASYDAVQAICDEMVVVFGHIPDSVAAALGDRPFHQAESDPDAPMYESIRAGLRAAHRVAPQATVVLQPGDHPEVAPSTLSGLSNQSIERPRQAIIPQYA